MIAEKKRMTAARRIIMTLTAASFFLHTGDKRMQADADMLLQLL